MRHEHVLRLDVAVDHAARVRVLECARQRKADLEHLLVGERLLRDQLRERVALDQLGDQVEGAVVCARLVQRDDRRVREARRRERLAGRALTVAVRPQPNALDGHLAVQQLVVGAPDDAEAAAAELLEQSVAAEHELLLAGLPAGLRDPAPSRLRRGPACAAIRLNEGL